MLSRTTLAASLLIALFLLASGSFCGAAAIQDPQQLSAAEGWSLCVAPHQVDEAATRMRLVFQEEAGEPHLDGAQWIVPTQLSAEREYRLICRTAAGEVHRLSWKARDTNSRMFFFPRDVQVTEVAVESPTSLALVSRLAYKQAIRSGFTPPILLTAPGEQIHFALQTVGGEVALSEEFRGKTVLIDCWATWCGPCQPISKKLMEVSPQHEDLAVVFLIWDDGSTQEAVAEKLQELPDDWIVVQIPYETSRERELWELSLAGGAKLTLPHLILFDADGVVQESITPADADEVERRVLEQLKR